MIVIVNYNVGNTASLQYALQRIGAASIVTDNPALIRTADKVFLPGVGEAGTAMQYLRAKKLDTVIKELTQPVLGICLGMQLLCHYSSENDTHGLGIFDTVVHKFPPLLKVPHVGWNAVSTGSTTFDAYFVHSYYAAHCADTTEVTNYSISFSAALQKNNFYGVQYHPEKSGPIGAQIIKKFLQL